jgi:hypothetical protein
MYVMVRCLAICALMCACDARLGQIQNNATGGDAAPGSSSNDGGTDGQMGVAPPDAPLGPWGTPAIISTAADAGDNVDDCTMSSDTLDLLYAVQQQNASTKQLWEMTRASASAAWGTPVERDELNIGTSEESPRLSLDNLTVYYGVDDDIYQATRPAIGEPFGTPTAVTIMNSGTLQKWLAICENDAVMISRSDPTTANMDLFEGTLSGGATTVDTVLNSTSNEISTFLSKDCLTTYFASNRSGSTQIYTSTRPAVGQPWTTPTNAMAPFSSSDGTDNEDPWISVDQRTFVFASIRGGGTTKQLYISTR